VKILKIKQIENEKILETRRNIGRGGCYALYFCGK
jgi:hypothetical protein